jgi:perosamine synthetase
MSRSLVAEIVAAVEGVVGAARPISLHEPEFKGNEWAYVKDCIDTGWVSSAGAYVPRFEQALCDFTGSPFAVAVVNGTAALQVALLLCGVTRGDEVLIPTLTFIATANAVSYTGATPHFIDSEERTLGVDPDALASHLDEIAELRDGACFNRHTGARIRALVPMHTFGHPVRIDELMALCARWGIIVIEDAAESLGSTCHGRHAGTFGQLACLSFNGNKIVTTGGGGAILTADPGLARRARHLVTTARVQHAWSFIHDEVGYNYRMPNLNAALGCAQIERLASFVERKRDLAARYIAAFEGVTGARIMREPEGTSSNYWLNAVLLDPDAASARDAVLETTNGRRIMTRPVWTLMHTLPMYASAPRATLPIAEDIERRLINVPSSASLQPAHG